MQTLSSIQTFYREFPKPEKFGNPEHCAECAEHNETLKAHTPESISLAELGNPGWDPICYVDTADQFRYYLPALARLACGQGDDYYLGQFLFHLNEARIQNLDEVERELVADFLEELTSAIPEEIEGNLDTDELLERLIQLRGRRYS